jgi:hypothetical protein
VTSNPLAILAAVVIFLVALGLTISNSTRTGSSADGATGGNRMRMQLPPVPPTPFSTLNISRSYLSVQSAMTGCKLDERDRILCAPDFFFLPSGYEQTFDNKYDVEVSETEAQLSWQYRVYQSVLQLAQKLKAKRLIDVGCGSGKKLADMHPTLGNDVELVCIDFGSNLEKIRKEFPFLRIIEHDLNTPIDDLLPAEEFKGSIIINADNIEHVLHSHLLVSGFKSWMQNGAYALVLSTPDRERTRAGLGEDRDKVAPLNRAHIREWSLCELIHFLGRYGPPLTLAGWTEDNNRDKHLWTNFLVSLNTEVLHRDGALKLPTVTTIPPEGGSGGASKAGGGGLPDNAFDFSTLLDAGLYEPVTTTALLQCIHKMQEPVVIERQHHHQRRRR